MSNYCGTADHVPIYTGYPGKSYVSISLETNQCCIYIGQDEQNPAGTVHRALELLAERGKIKKAPISDAPTKLNGYESR